MTTRILAAVAALSVLVAVGCGGNNEDDAAPGGGEEPILRLFDPAGGDALARSMLPEPADFPGAGWEVTARDDFDDNNGEYGDGYGDEGGQPFPDLPSCQHLNEFAFSLPGQMNGSGDDGTPPGRAQIELSRTLQGATFPTSVEVEVEIAETVAEVQAGWSIARTLLTSDETKRCFEDLFRVAFAEQDGTGQVTAEATSLDPAAAAPHGGASLAFGIKVSMNDAELFDMHFEIHFWPYSNARVSVLIISEGDTLTPEVAADLLSAVDAKVVAAGDTH